MHTISQILANKTFQEIWFVTPESTVFDAIQLMADKRIGALLVMSQSESELKGIISERDYAREVILKGRSSRATPVGAIMSTKVISVPPTYKARESLAVMTANRIRHLPIVDDGEVVGVISIGDLVKDVINEQQSTIEQLENYIRG